MKPPVLRRSLLRTETDSAYLLHTAPAGSKGTHLSANLSSNNPFRNRAASPSNVDVAAHSSLSTSPFDDPPKRPLSRNPFLDQPAPLRSPGAMSANSDSKSLSAEEIFVRHPIPRDAGRYQPGANSGGRIL